MPDAPSFDESEPLDEEEPDELPVFDSLSCPAVTVTGKKVKSVELIVALYSVEVTSAVVAVRITLSSEVSINGSVKMASGACIPPVQKALSEFDAIEQSKVTARLPVL